MANSRQIREWARANDLEVSDAGPLSSDVRRAYYDAHDGSNTASEDSLTDNPPQIVEEVAPKVSDETPAIGRVINRAKKAASSSRARGKKVARKSLASVISMGYEWLAVPAASVSAPVSYMMQLQAPVVGEILDGPIAGTFLDKLLQPIASVNEAMEPVNAVLTPLVGAFLLDKFPQHADKIIPKLRTGLYSWAKVAGPHYARIEELNEAFEKEHGESIDKVLEQLLAVVQLSHEKKNSQEWGP
jgi:hypothetical protein